MAGGLRHNEGKQRYDLLPPSWPAALVAVLTKGAEKYEDRNWEKGMDWAICYASLMRHIQAWWEGNDIDPESGLPHMAHVAWNALALLEYSKTHPELDNRPFRAGDNGKDKEVYQEATTREKVDGFCSGHGSMAVRHVPIANNNHTFCIKHGRHVPCFTRCPGCVRDAEGV